MAGAEISESSKKNSNTHLIAELEELTQTLYQSHISSSSSSSTTTRRTASFALPQTSAAAAIPVPDEEKTSSKSRARRLSFTPWKSRPNLDNHNKTDTVGVSNLAQEDIAASGSSEKKGLWNWKPIRALSRIGMQKISCLFSVEVIAAQGLPSSMNGLRLSVRMRKKETKDGAVQTMPSRVLQGSADFEETLFVKCHVYCSKQETMKFEPRPFLIYLFAVDAEDLNFGTSSVDLSRLIEESVEKLSYEGKRVRQWDRSFGLSGKAKGGELVVKLGFQIMEKDGGVGIYGRAAEGAKIDRSNTFSYSFSRKQSKKSFSVPSSRVRTASMSGIQGRDYLNVDETLAQRVEARRTEEDLDLLEFEVVDKGVEEAESENIYTRERPGSREEIRRLTELDSIAEQIKALQSKIEEDKLTKEETECQRLDADEETVTMEFLHLLEEEEEELEERSNKLNHPEIPPLKLDGEDSSREIENRAYVPDLGKGLGCVIQTRNGGYLAATNPLDTEVSRKETPKLAMQISKPVVLPLTSPVSGLELLRRMAAVGIEELSDQLQTLMPIDELMGKTAEQIAFEGIASAIIQGRNSEGATSSAARTVAAVKTMAAALAEGRRERIATGIWNVVGETENLVTVEETVAFSLQRIEAMAVEALKIQADMAEEDAPFEISPLYDSAISLEKWVESDNNDASSIVVLMVVQLRDPLRRFEAVGGPIVAIVQAKREENRGVESDEEERRYRVRSADVAGLRARSGGRRSLSAWDGEKQRLTARQWLVAHSNAKHGKRSNKQVYDGETVNGGDLLWSVSSRVMADMWLKSMRHPDIKFAD